MKHRVQGFLAGFLCCALFMIGIVVFAANNQTLQAMFNGIKIVIDGKEIHPKNAIGENVEPFIVDGTTYLPIRAVADAFGKSVQWNGSTNTVYIGDIKGNLESPTVKSEDATYKIITAQEAKSRIDSGDKVIVLDVRTKAEYDQEHISNAILIPNETITDTKPDLLPDTKAEILVYCRSGNRSAQAAKKLIALGYTNVYDFGGIIDWPYDKVTGQ